MKSTYLCLACLLMIIVAGHAVPASPSIDDLTANPANAVMVSELGDGVWGAARNYLERDADGQLRNWKLGTDSSNPEGGYIGWGEAPIRLAPPDKRFGRARIAAFYEAYSLALSEFGRTQAFASGVKTANTSFRGEQDFGRLDPATTDNVVKAIGERLEAITVSALDRGLERLGADPSVFPSLSVGEKRRLAEEMIARNMVIEAASRVKGVRVLATFEDENNVGVLIIHHSRLEQLADQIVKGVSSSPGLSDLGEIRARVDELSETDLIFQHGIRVLIDSDGAPVVLAFGQSSPAVSRSDSDRSIRMAISQSSQVAEAQADAALTEFVGMTMFDAREAVLSGGDFQTAKAVRGVVTLHEGAEFYEDLNSLVEQTSETTLSGVQTIRRWRANHPDTGHLYVGVVRVWRAGDPLEYHASAAETHEVRGREQSGSTPVDGPIRQSPDLGVNEW